MSTAVRMNMKATLTHGLFVKPVERAMIMETY